MTCSCCVRIWCVRVCVRARAHAHTHIAIYVCNCRVYTWVAFNDFLQLKTASSSSWGGLTRNTCFSKLSKGSLFANSVTYMKLCASPNDITHRWCTSYYWEIPTYKGGEVWNGLGSVWKADNVQLSTNGCEEWNPKHPGKLTAWRMLQLQSCNPNLPSLLCRNEDEKRSACDLGDS